MFSTLAFLAVASVAVFAGGCLCLSVTLSGLVGRDGAQVMHLLLPRMGAVMAPSLVFALACAGVSAWAGWRGFSGTGLGLAFGWTTLAFVLIALVTWFVHLPLNGQFLRAEPITPAHASVLLHSWLRWHHLRTALALSALGTLLWPLGRSYGVS